MIKVENIEVFNFEGAFRGLRNPMNSWEKSDSFFGCSNDSNHSENNTNCNKCLYDIECNDYYKNYIIGPNDINLAQRMICGGTDESKFMRQIFVTMDITAPFYWLKEFDTYKVGTVANSCSTMHKIASKEFTLDDFSHEHLDGYSLDILDDIIIRLNDNRKHFIETQDKSYWWQMIQLLPSSYNQRRTVTLNYQVLRAMYFARKAHKLDEWREFCLTVETLPYAKELICYKKEKK